MTQDVLKVIWIKLKRVVSIPTNILYCIYLYIQREIQATGHYTTLDKTKNDTRLGTRLIVVELV